MRRSVRDSPGGLPDSPAGGQAQGETYPQHRPKIRQIGNNEKSGNDDAHHRADGADEKDPAGSGITFRAATPVQGDKQRIHGRQQDQRQGQEH